jgi:HupE / UreJ protein
MYVLPLRWFDKQTNPQTNKSPNKRSNKSPFSVNEFYSFVQLGWRHIADPKAYDHLLFVITLCAPYRPAEWRRILLLVTAFTIGHSLTLVLAGFDLIRVPGDLVELLIPVTILLTALHNATRPPVQTTAVSKLFAADISVRYGFALFFGLIHGMGFSNFFRALLGETGNIALPLFGFNVGIELGQVLIVLCFFLFAWAIARFFGVVQRDWNLFISGAGAGVALVLILEGLGGLMV